MPLKLADQAAVLIVLPLCLELFLLGSLLITLENTEHQMQRIKHAKEVQELTNEATGRLVRGTSALASYAISKSPVFEQKFASVAADSAAEMDRLDSLVADNPKQRKAAQELEATVTRGFTLLSQLKHSFDTNKQPMDALQDLASSKNQISDIVQQAVGAAAEILREERESVDPNSNMEELLNKKLRTLVVTGICLAVCLATILAIYFYRVTRQRLNHLLRNTVQLAAERPLLPRLSGHDELAVLDGAFHDMATALSEAMQKERAIVDNAVDVVCSIDRQGTFAAINPAAIQLWGYQPDELLGRSYKTVVLPEDLSLTEQQMAKTLSTDSGITFENRALRKDNSVRDMLWSMQSSSQQRMIFCVVHDITERKEIERMKQEFLAIVSHDLRQPLSSMKLFLSMVTAGEYGSFAEPGQSKVKMLTTDVNRLTDLVSDLLDIDRLETGQMPLQRSAMRVLTAVERAKEAVSELANAKHIVVQSIGDGSVRCFADENRIVQVLVNLFSNAIKFSPEGALVTASWGWNDDYVKITVADQGCGIPKAFQELIFARYKQVSPEYSKNHRGLGLGLHLSKIIIDCHGGTIGVESEEGSGSRFWFQLPNKTAVKGNGENLDH